MKWIAISSSRGSSHPRDKTTSPEIQVWGNAKSQQEWAMWDLFNLDRLWRVGRIPVNISEWNYKRAGPALV